MNTIPLLRTKRRTLADLDPNSLAAALHHRELAAMPAAQREPPDEAPEQRPARSRPTTASSD